MNMRRFIRIVEATDEPAPDEPFEHRPTISPPDWLYHHTSPDHREAIEREGLLLRHSEAARMQRYIGAEDWEQYGAVYMALKPWSVAETDIWLVDVRGLDLEWDDTNEDDPTDYWWSVYTDLPPSRLTLFYDGRRNAQVSPMPAASRAAIEDAEAQVRK